METLPMITIAVLLGGFIIKSTPKVNNIMPYFVLIAALLGGVLGAFIYGADINGIIQGLQDALIATGLYEAGKGLGKVITDDNKI